MVSVQSAAAPGASQLLLHTVGRSWMADMEWKCTCKGTAFLGMGATWGLFQEHKIAWMYHHKQLYLEKWYSEEMQAMMLLTVTGLAKNAGSKQGHCLPSHRMSTLF